MILLFLCEPSNSLIPIDHPLKLETILGLVVELRVLFLELFTLGILRMLLAHLNDAPIGQHALVHHHGGSELFTQTLGLDLEEKVFLVDHWAILFKILRHYFGRRLFDLLILRDVC